VCGIASIDGVSFMFIGHQKGRNTKENIYRNFGMPQPNGYRKALRFMRHADKFGALWTAGDTLLCSGIIMCGLRTRALHRRT